MVTSARIPCVRELTITFAPSRFNNSAVEEPRPPAPPTSRISSPAIGKVRSLDGDVAECDGRQKQRQHFAVAEIVLEQPFGENREDHSNRAVKYKSRFG